MQILLSLLSLRLLLVEKFYVYLEPHPFVDLAFQLWVIHDRCCRSSM